MRTFTALICCLYMLAPTSAIAQQGESCDANPRWLLVTVVSAVDSFGTESEYDGEYLSMVDRCEGDTFNIRAYSGSAEGIATEIAWTYLSTDRSKTNDWVRLWVKESLQDICRAMWDCSDATSRP